MTREHAVVTGGSSGIGLAVVRRLMKRGLAVTVLDMQPPPDDGPQAFQVDVTREPDVRAALAEAARTAGTPTRLVTCHGIRGEFKPALELNLDAYRRVLDVHLVGTLVTARSLVAGLLADDATNGGSIVTISSTTAYGGWANQADYGVAKAAVEQLTQNLAIEWAPLGVRVNAVAPGHTLTPMVQEMVDQGYDLSATEARMPLGRLCTPDEMAAAIEFLLLDATFSTGVRMPVDGGWTAVGK
ncbi:NAD(P)-dependent dehydrogenase, short-chain alcohol dehydrogenase family [Thermomonospora echinospora]|uniref:NAD(P)-dependent dehydrogenase, short-chain alcohol dehydrogenase family n=1 Tax=Thermomonospora echinospora TaxID=1992 RepID=A0A1H6E927_9ACTN|nr:SDR family oxidoreductase [Thermomonospora echinospora]SEG93761.1 NAD(P)-dependent dehydrogenase, short-chain alcohol dehydrogenase family [Thermomonospora echinospora]